MKQPERGVTQIVADYVKTKGISITALSEGTGISYGALQPSITGKRRLRADEFLLICHFLEVPPERFSVDQYNVNKT